MPWWQALIIWCLAVGIQITGYTGLSLCWAFLQEKRAVPRVFLPLIGMTSFFITYAVASLLVSWTTQRGLDEIFSSRVLLTGFVFAMIGEAIYFAFVLPQMLRDIQEENIERTISIAGQTFDLENVQTLRGQEHFVLIQTKEGTTRLRGRLSDLVQQTDESDGVLAHRSYWIARKAISRLETESGCDSILTEHGERLKVAQPRRAEVRAWVQHHAPEATLQKGFQN